MKDGDRMNKFQRWVSTHALFAKIFISVVVCVIYTALLFWLDAAWWIMILIDLLLLFLTNTYVNNCVMKRVDEGVKVLDHQCDPTLLLKETEALLNQKLPEVNRQIVTINYSVALRNLGEIQKAFDLLASVHIDKCPTMLTVNKLLYYNNMADLLEEQGEYKQAEVYFNKLVQVHTDLKDQTQRKHTEYLLTAGSVSRCIQKQEYETALAILNEMPPATLRQEVEGALKRAQITLALNRPEEAKKHLQFVIEKGNRLYCVPRAQELLEHLSQPATK